MYEELEIIEKCTKKSWERGVLSGEGGGGVGQGGVERRIEVVMEMPKKWGVRVGVNEELKLL